MAPKFQRHDHLVSVLFGELLSHSYTVTFSMFLHLVDSKLESLVTNCVGYSSLTLLDQ